MSIAVVATIYPKPQHRAEVIAIFEETVARVHAEDEGCELYALHEGPDRLVMIEKWSGNDALKTHATSAALTDMGPRLDGKLLSAPDVQVLQPHPAGTAAQGSL